MTLSGLLIWLFIGAVAGWLGGLLVHGYGFGLLGIAALQGIVGAIIGATIGAVVILLLLSMVRRA